MTADLIDQEAFHAALRSGGSRGSGVVRQATVLRAADDGSRVIRFVFSDGSVDRMGDTINPNGWDVTAYRQNPVVLWAHDSSAPPIGRTLSVWSDGTRLLGDIEFIDAETYEFADTIFRLLKKDYLRSGSVGFKPISYKFSDSSDRPYGVDFERQELLEFSIVPVPANPNALSEARSKGLLSSRDLMRFRQAGTKHQSTGDDAGLGARLARVRRAAEIAERVGGLSRIRLADSRSDTAYVSKAEAAEQVALLRARHGLKRLDGRIIAAQSAHRFGLS